MHLPAHRLRWVRVAGATAAAVALAVGPTACGSDDSNTGTTETSVTTDTPAATTDAGREGHDHGETGDAPTAQSLQAGLEALVDPDVSVDDKVGMVVDGEDLRDHFEQLNVALQTYRGVAFQVAEVAVDGADATGRTTITSPTGHSAPPVEMAWQHHDDVWKLSSNGACILLGFAQIPCSPA